MHRINFQASEKGKDNHKGKGKENQAPVTPMVTQFFIYQKIIMLSLSLSNAFITL